MQKIIPFLLLLSLSGNVRAQRRFSNNELIINGFRNPSIGLEYRRHALSVHAGYYLTALQPGITTTFFKTGLTAWFLPVGRQTNPSSFYAGASYLRGTNLDYRQKNALGVEAGFRWMVWKGLQFRIGALALAARGRAVRINPTPGISYSLFF